MDDTDVDPSEIANLMPSVETQRRTDASLHALEDALESAAPGREQRWLHHVRGTLDALIDTLTEQGNEDDALLSRITRSHRELRRRVHGLREQSSQIRSTLEVLQEEVLAALSDPPPDVFSLRERLSEALTAIRRLQSRERDLIGDASGPAGASSVSADSVAVRPGTRTTREETPSALDTKRAGRARSNAALRRLEQQAGASLPSDRRDAWVDELRVAAEELEKALATEGVGEPNFLVDIEQAEPRMRGRVERLRQQYSALADDLRRFITVVENTEPDGVDVADLRRTLDRLASEHRYLRAREADLVYETYNVDLGVGD
jgi:chromosome segregation ATPase